MTKEEYKKLAEETFAGFAYAIGSIASDEERSHDCWRAISNFLEKANADCELDSVCVGCASISRNYYTVELIFDTAKGLRYLTVEGDEELKAFLSLGHGFDHVDVRMDDVLGPHVEEDWNEEDYYFDQDYHGPDHDELY